MEISLVAEEHSIPLSLRLNYVTTNFLPPNTEISAAVEVYSILHKLRLNYVMQAGPERNRILCYAITALKTLPQILKPKFSRSILTQILILFTILK